MEVIVIIGIVFLILWLYAKVSEIKKVSEQKNLIDKAKILWANQQYEQFFTLIDNRINLFEVVSYSTFLKAHTSFSTGKFLELLVKYHFIEPVYQDSLYGLYSYSGTKKICGAKTTDEVVNILYQRIEKSIDDYSNTEDVLLLYFAIYELASNGISLDLLDVMYEYIREKRIHIYDDEIISIQDKWNKLIGVAEIRFDLFNKSVLDLFKVSGSLRKSDFLKTSLSAKGIHDNIQLNGHNLQFYPNSHEYFVDGIKVLTATQLLKSIDYSYGNYGDVSQAVLNRAAAKGTALHSEIQNFEEKGISGHTQEFHKYISLKQKNNFVVDSCEKYVLIYYDGVPISAGRFDLLITTQEGKKALADIKRTSTYKKSDVTKQLNLYRYGFVQTYGQRIEETYCVRLREDVAQFRAVEIDDMLAENILRTYVDYLQKRSKTYWDILSSLVK